ncbi:putative glycosyl hydrolase family 16 [Rosellinia necatrix]|uniref:Putative glycosyl hydrolase family 16 n=1 Tax=Rosellinia necatrix TaxID=77044 RepID=A0A1W2TJ84_ROSNE|nr:putative glycosyl hydrolase family 16 [Rosellinia necatrix]
MFSKALAFALAATSVVAEGIPGYGGYSAVWQENFNGAAGSLVNEGNWNIIERSQNANNEWQTYTRSNKNHQLSGGATLQIVPQNNNGAWTSARLESKYVFTPADGRRTIIEAKIRFGNNAEVNKQGIWPAFWLLGDSIRHGTPWPQCGEVDILERVSGHPTGYGTVHCDVAPGGICNEFNGIGGTTSIPDNGWHTWRVVFDRTPDWTGESITWYKDGGQFMQVTGGRIGNQNVWNSLATTPQYIILNVAVGGDFPGAPNGNTLGNWGSEMEVAYVAHYQSN